MASLPASQWQLLETPITGPLPVVDTPAQRQVTAPQAAAIVGNGIIRPFRRNKQSDWTSANDYRLVSSAIGQILGTQSDTASANMGGELPWRTEFGSALNLLKHANNTQALVERARSMVVLAIRRWEPRARIRGLTVKRTRTNTDLDTLTLKLKYTIVRQSSGDNQVINTEVTI